MIFTIGFTESYEQAFKEKSFPFPKKIGKKRGYEGGCVWKTLKGATNNCPKGYSVYGVLADWNKNTEKSKVIGCKSNHNHLLKTSTLIKLS